MDKVKKKKKKAIKKKLTRKYRLVILNEDSFEERISFKINRLNILILGRSEEHTSELQSH